MYQPFMLYPRPISPVDCVIMSVFLLTRVHQPDFITLFGHTKSSCIHESTYPWLVQRALAILSGAPQNEIESGDLK